MQERFTGVMLMGISTSGPSMTLRVRFHGAAGEVTGSCHLLEVGGRRVLLDCGLFQGDADSEARNRRPFPFDPAGIDAVVLSHAHLDHAGRLPLLVRHGFRGHIYAHPATRDLARIMLMDAAHLAEADAGTASRKAARRGLPEVLPLFGIEDVARCLRRFRDLDYGQRVTVLPGLDCRIQDAGHILGSAVVELWVDDRGLRRKLVFSGDLGHAGSPIMPPPTSVSEADLVIMESVYGDRRHRDSTATAAELGEIIRTADVNGGNVLIPAFAVGRTQELLFLLAKHHAEWGLDGWQLFLDSPMAIQATEVYAAHAGLLDTEATEHAREAVLSEALVHRVTKVADSMAINRVKQRALIIAGSGMCNGGRILHHLKQRLWREDTHVVFAGYQAGGTLGRRLVDGAKEVRLWGEPVRVGAQIHTLGGLSAHADREGLCGWYAGFQSRPQVALVHGEPQAATSLAAELRSRFACPVTVPAQGESLDLEALATSSMAAVS